MNSLYRIKTMIFSTLLYEADGCAVLKPQDLVYIISARKASNTEIGLYKFVRRNDLKVYNAGFYYSDIETKFEKL